MTRPTGARPKRAVQREDAGAIKRALLSSAFAKFTDGRKLFITRHEAAQFWSCPWPGTVEAVERMTALLLGREKVELRELAACHDWLVVRHDLKGWV
jgi:hypothetical protein